MPNMDRSTLMDIYASQFGRLTSKGAGYLGRILRRYDAVRCSSGSPDYKQLVLDVAAEKGIQPESIRRAIQRYVNDGWNKEECFRSAWAEYTGWDKDTPPDVDTAIKLICESFSHLPERFQVTLKDKGCPAGGEDFPTAESKALLDELLNTRYLSFENPYHRQAYVDYLSYRVQRDLYELVKGDGRLELEDLSWREFVEALCYQKQSVKAAFIVARQTIMQFLTSGYFNFDSADVHLSFDDDALAEDGDTVRSARLFPAYKGEALINAILYRAEQVQYARQLNRGKEYTWEQFIAELSSDQVMWEETVDAFRDALVRLDFKPLWDSEELDAQIGEMN